MANQNFFNKNSQYISSLVDYVNDTKPYHTKLTEISEEYQFFDSMDVKIVDKLSSKLKISTAFLYNFFSSGDVTFNTVDIKSLNTTQKNVFPSNESLLYPGAIKAFRDENTDFSLVPFVYSKSAYSGDSTVDVLIERNGIRSTALGLTEGLDWFQSHGGLKFQIKQTLDYKGDFVPLWSEIRDDNVVITSAEQTRLLANDVSNPSSASSKILVLLTNTRLSYTSGSPEEIELTRLIDLISAILPGTSIQLPRDYEVLISLIPALQSQLSALSPPLYFNLYTDLGVRQSGSAGARIEIPSSASPLETWDIIKVNPIAFSRPVFRSTRYGYIQDLYGNAGSVTLLDQSTPTSTIKLTATSSTTFVLSSSVDPLYTGTATVGVLYNDSILAFTIINGSTQLFVPGDYFFIDIFNEEPKIVNLSLDYGYDLDAYDDQTIVYNSTPFDPDYNVPLNFTYGTRFTDYDLNILQVSLTQAAISGRSWRMIAVPDMARPVPTTPIIDPVSGLVSLVLYYSTSFDVQISDDGFQTNTSLGTVNVGDFFDAQGVSFTILNGSKPFIGGVDINGDSGGDTFTFAVSNQFPILTEASVDLNSVRFPRLIMHSSGFYDAPDASWTLTFTSSTKYSIIGVQLDGSGNLIDSCDLTLQGIIPNEGTSFKGLGVHYTVFPGSVGFQAGDTFKFSTFKRKPMFLVHGSVSGWTADAVIGEEYNNGFIKFTIQKPSVRLFDHAVPEPLVLPVAPNSWASGSGTINITRLRDDTPELRYDLKPLNGGLTVTRSDKGVIGFLPLTGTFSEEYITIEAINISDDPIQIQIIPDDFMLWNCQDSIILRPAISEKLPTASDFVLVDKRSSDSLRINLAYSQVLDSQKPDLSVLGLKFIDPTYIDLYTGAGNVELSSTSPETALFQNWIPISLKPFDSSTSVAVFPDAANLYEVYGTGSGIKIGTVQGKVLTWDSAFFGTYLPLNAEANVVVHNSGFCDTLNVRIRESIRFLVGGGALTSDFLFGDSINVQIDEEHNWNIIQTLEETFNAEVLDGPFGGFLAGYDNIEYELELGTGYYDLGGTWVPGTSALEQDYFSTTGFGVPALGLGIDITIGGAGKTLTNPSTESATTGISENLVLLVLDKGAEFDMFGFDVGGFDTYTERTAIMNSASLPAFIPAPPIGTTYLNFEAQYNIVGVVDPLGIDYLDDFAARIFEIHYSNTAANHSTLLTMPNPKIFIWLPMWSTAQEAPFVEKFGLGKYRVSIPVASEAKLYIIPGI
jgi:hypothetical protein